MPAYNIKEQFAPLVEAGTKRQTIRPPRKRPTRVGDTLYLYTGMRTKQCRKLREETCTSVWKIEIATPSQIFMFGEPLSPDLASRRRWQLGYDDMLAIAIADGFENDIIAMTSFFQQQYGLPFTGEVIRWMPDTVTCTNCEAEILLAEAGLPMELSSLSHTGWICRDCWDTIYGWRWEL